MNFTTQKLKTFCKGLDNLNSREKWDIYYYPELKNNISFAHNVLETLIEWRNNEESLSDDDYTLIEEYIEVADRLVRIIDYAIWKLRKGIDNDYLLPPDYDY